MPAVVVDSSVLISLAAGEQFQLLRTFYSTIHLPTEVWHEVTSVQKPFGTQEVQNAHRAGWLTVHTPRDVTRVLALPFNLQKGEAQAIALAVELRDPLLLIDEAQGRRAAAALKLNYTGTLGILLRAKMEGKTPELKFILGLLKERTTFWLSAAVYEAALKQVGEKP